MACFAALVAEAVITTAVSKIISSKEKEGKTYLIHTESGIKELKKISFSTKLNWLSKLLWGGSALLCYEHLWHGEIVPFFPFFTAASNPADTAEMLREIAVVGGSMSLVLTGVWCIMLLVAASIQKKAINSQPSTKQEGSL